MAKDMDGVVIKAGEFLSFKDDVEVTGKVIRVTGEMVRLDMTDSRTGQPYEQSVQARRTWHE